MITNIGRLRRKLVELDIDKDTILIFITDNGSVISGRKYNAGMPATKEANGTADTGCHFSLLGERWPGRRTQDRPYYLRYRCSSDLDGSLWAGAEGGASTEGQYGKLAEPHDFRAESVAQNKTGEVVPDGSADRRIAAVK